MAVSADSPVGELVGQLLHAVLEADVNYRTRDTLDQLQNNLQSLGSDVDKFVELRRKLDLSASETERMIELLKNGRKLLLDHHSNDAQFVLACTTCILTKGRNLPALEELNASILRYFEEDMNAKIARTVLQIEAEAERVRVVGYTVCAAPAPPEFTVGFDFPMNQLKDRLLREEVTVSVHTVIGPPGSGKTTLAKMFCWDDQVTGLFKENIFFISFGKVPKLNSIVQRLFQHNGYPVPKFQSEQDVVNQLENLLKQIGKKGPILVVLDNVSLESKSLIDNFVFPIPNYKILVTSRFTITRFGSLEVLYPIEEEDAAELFCHSANLNQSSSNIPDAIVREIVRSCSGSPLELTVTGTSLRNKGRVAWRKAVEDLSLRHRNLDSESDVLSCPQEESLDPMPMECYKDLGLFPKDQRIRAAVLVDLWAELHSEDDDTAIKKIYELVNQNLAAIIVTRKITSDVADYNYIHVTQHGGLRDVVIFQNGKEPEHKRNRLIIEVNENNLPAWWSVEKEYPIAARILSISTDETFSSEWCNLLPTEVEALVLNVRQKKSSLPTFMKKMNKLKVLTITNYDFYPVELENFELLHHLPNLKRLWLEKVSIPFLSQTRVQLKNLRKCSFFMCNLNKVFKVYTAQVSDMLPNLVEMDFDYCTMEELPLVLSSCVLLTKLRITNCHKFSTLPEGIGNLVNLELWSLSSCLDLVELPNSIKNLKSLKFLDISDCINLSKLPDDMGKLSNLEKLNVKGCLRLTELPTSIRGLVNLKDVVCDEKMAHPFKNVFDLKPHVVKDDFNLDFLNNLRS